MAIFFLMVGLEIKRELVEGELSSPKQALLPVFAAAGGAIVPALIYWSFNKGSAGDNGWGIPMATDIAFALAVLSLLGKRVPATLKIFLAALAIVDDLIAILVIAIFYSAELHLNYLLFGAGIVALLYIFNRAGLKHLIFYLVPGLALWYCIHHSGIHATIAGVLTAITIPTTKDASESPLEKLEHILTKPVNFLIMPLFALANTLIPVRSEMFNGLTSMLGAGIFFGLLFGKPIGITLTCWIMVKMKIAELPRYAGWKHVIGLGLLGGIGFTMSIFIALLSFSEPDLQLEAKFAVLITSTVAALLGYGLLSIKNNKVQHRDNSFNE